MIFRAPILSLFCLTALLPLLPAAGPVPVEALVTKALASNSEIAFYEAQLALASGQRLDAGKLANPEVSAQLARWSVGGAGDGPAWQAAVSQTFEWPGRLALRKALADRQVDLAGLGLESFRNSLAARVRSLAVSLQFSQEKTEATRKVMDRLRGVLTVLVQRDPAGPAPLLETRILEANLLTLSRQLSLAGQESAGFRLELNLLCGERPDAALTVAGDLPELPAAPETGTLLAAAVERNFDVRMRAAELRLQGFAVSLAYHEKLPSWTVQPFVASQKAGRDKETTTGLSVSLPLPLWNRNQGNEAAARARQSQAEASLAMTQREVTRQIVGKAQTYAAQVAEMSQWSADAPDRFREAAELGDRHYQLGAIPVSTYLELQKSYLEGLDAVLSTRAEALSHLQDLELLTGLFLRPKSPATSTR